MTDSVDEYIDEIMKAAEKQDNVALDRLKASPYYSLHVRDKKQRNAANRVGRTGKEEACDFLLKNDAAHAHDLAVGAAYGNHEKLVLKYLGLSINHNYKDAAAYAAKKGHKDLAFTLLKTKEAQAQDFNYVAAYAAQGGHKKLMFELFDRVQAPQAPDYDKAAQRAARGNHLELVEELAKKANLDYNEVAANLALIGNKEKACLYLKRASQPDYNLVASYAAWGGHEQFCLELLQNVQKEESSSATSAAGSSKPSHILAAKAAMYAALGGDQSLTLKLLNVAGSNTNYNEAAAYSASGGYKKLTIDLLTMAEHLDPTRKMDFRNAASKARACGHKQLSEDIKKKFQPASSTASSPLTTAFDAIRSTKKHDQGQNGADVNAGNYRRNTSARV